MKKHKIIFTLSMLSIFLLAACFDSDLKKTKESTTISMGEEDTYAVIGEKEIEEAKSLRDLSSNAFKDFETFDFASNIQVISIREDNSDALKSEPDNGLDTTKSVYLKERGTLYLYNDSKLPTKKTKMLIMEDYNNFDAILENNLLSSPKEIYNSKVKRINKEIVNNTNRLFLNEEYTIEKLDNGVINFKINGEELEIEPGSESSLELKEKGVSSKITISNYGLLNTSSNIKYEKPQEQITKELKNKEKDKAEIEKIKEEDKKSSEE